MKDLSKKLAKSSLFTLIGQFSALFVKFVSNIMFAALLFPEAFAQIAIVNSIITGFVMFSEIGIRSKVIESDQASDKDFLDTAWSLQILRGVILYGVLCIAAYPFSRFYSSPDLFLAIPVAGSVLLISSLTPTWIYEQNRNLVVSKQVFSEVSSLLLSTGIAIIFAYLYESFWALVLSLVLNEAFKQAFFYYFAGKSTNTFKIYKCHAIEILKFGQWLLLSSIFGYVINHADKLLLAAKFDKNVFGLYAIAFSIANIPIMIGVPFSSKIFLPLLRRLRPWEFSENRNHLQKYRAILTLLLIFVSVVLILIADTLVKNYYDTRYSLVSPILVLILLAQMPLLVLLSYDQVFLAVGDSHLFAKRIAISSIVRTFLMLIGLHHFGLIGVIVSTGLSAIVTYPVLFIFLRKYGGLDITHDVFMFFVIFVLIFIIFSNYQIDLKSLQIF